DRAAAHTRGEVPRAGARSDQPERRRRGRRRGGPGPRAETGAARHHQGQGTVTDPRRRLPAVDALLAEPDVAALLRAHPRGLVVATLVEVGITKRTHLRDYEGSVTDRTRLLLKVHRTNFQVTGFTAEVSAQEIAGVARARGAASLYDLGSGLLVDLSPWGLAGEPTVGEALARGVDAVGFSGDKLLGG